MGGASPGRHQPVSTSTRTPTLALRPEPDTPAGRHVNASRYRADAARCGLTVRVPLVPLAPHRPVRLDLEVVSCVHAVQPREPPVVRQGRFVRHPAGNRRQAGGCWGEEAAGLPQRSGGDALVNERRDPAGKMRGPDTQNTSLEPRDEYENVQEFGEE